MPSADGGSVLEGFAPPRVHLRPRAGGGWLLASAHALPAQLPSVMQRVAHWAAAAPARDAFVECRGGRLARRIGCAELLARARCVAAGLRARGLHAGRPFLTLAEPGIDHAVLRVAALAAGVPFAPLSPQLLRLPGGPARLAAIVHLLGGGLVCADDAVVVRAALRAVGLAELEVLGRGEGRHDWPQALAGADGCDTPAAALEPDAVAAVFFTSGSTGAPKGVITTQRMLAANQAAYAVLWPFLAERPPRLLDWLPWHHTFGGNDNFHKMLWHGGTLFIDDGRPTPEGMSATLANIEAVSPTLHINVPRGLELLLDALARAPAARAALFAQLRAIFFAGAGLSRALWARLQALVDDQARAGGRRVALVSGWGSTECGSTICLVHHAIASPQVVGLPLPGCELALVPLEGEGGKLEARVRGPNVMPGYWPAEAAGCGPAAPAGEPDRSAFDAEGYLRTGDAVRLADPARPEAGLMFDGRVAEDFKLATGTWVSVGPLRLALLAALAPLVRELAVAGQDEPQLALLLFPEPEACREAAALPPGAALAEIAAAPALHARIAAALRAHNERQGGSSTRVRRAALLAELPGAVPGELSDKGSLNQRLALAQRAARVRALFAEPPPAGVIDLADRGGGRPSTDIPSPQATP
ncbi:MAG: AMP-binding protein [Rubrivivax sp.]|nr:AMP-binding protein [Rubrivivax sp.]